MSFIKPPDARLRTKYIDVPKETEDAVGPLKGKRVLDVGSAALLTSFGLLSRGPSELVGLDIKPAGEKLIEAQLKRLVDAGFKQAVKDRERLRVIQYDGVTFPLEDNSFDVVFSWGVMEHVANVPAVLAEMRRVMKPDGIGFIKVYPWYHSNYGSHLSDFTERFAHLKLDDAGVRAQVEAYVAANPQVESKHILNGLWREYTTLNKYSANMFYRDVRAAGFSKQVWKVTAYQEDLTDAPAGIDFSDLILSGSEVILRK